MTLNHGICEESGSSFSFLSVMILAALKDYEASMFFIQAASKIQDRAPSRYHETKVVSGFLQVSGRKEPAPEHSHV